MNDNRQSLIEFRKGIGVIEDALSVLSPEDRQDAINAIPYFFHDNPEESAAAERAIDEIFCPPKGGVSRLN